MADATCIYLLNTADSRYIYLVKDGRLKVYLSCQIWQTQPVSICQTRQTQGMSKMADSTCIYLLNTADSRNHNKIGFIDGTCKKDDSNLSLANQWDMCKSIVFTWILNSLSSDLYAGAIYAKIACELWTKLKDTYDKVDGSAVLYYVKLLNIFEKHNQLIRLMQFFMGLDENYLVIKSNILTREPLSLVKAAFAIVSGKESYRNITFTSSTKPTATAFVAKTFDKKRFNNNNNNKGSSSNSNNRGPNPNLKCTNCNKIGHTVDRYFEIVVYPAWYVKRTFNSNSRPVTSTNATVDPNSNNSSSSATSNSFDVVDISNLGLTVGHPNEYTVSLQSVHNLSRDNKLFVGFDEILDVLKSTLNLDIQTKTATTLTDHLCDICNKAKQTREPFSLSDHKSSKIGLSGIPSSMLSGKSPYFFVYGHDPSLSHFRVFGCLCYATILNNHDKFSSRLNDEGRVSSNDNGTKLSPDENQGNDDSGATSMDETNNTHPEGTFPNETDFINDFYEHSELNSDVEELPANTVRRSSRQTKLPSSLNDFIIEGKVKYGVERVVNYANLSPPNYCFISALNKSIEPTCYEEVVLDSNWIDAMNAKIEALNENQTWVIVDLPANRKAIGNKWIYKIKYKSNGDIDRYKARLVVKGFNQKEGIDFDETFSPVVKMSTVRCVIALSVTNNWPLFQLDVNNAFLYRDLDEDIYMTIPKGFANKDNKNKSANDHSLFTKSKNNNFIAPLVYVDDIVVTENCVNEIDKFKSFLKSKFKIKDLGHLKYILDYGLLGCKLVSTPMVPNSVLPYEPTEDDPLLDNITGYQKLLGKLIYLTHTRPDIAYLYLKGAPGKGIRYKYPDIKDTICGYSDADWAKCLKTRKSVTGYCVFFNNCLISWKSKKQNTISKSSTEAEYRSLSSATCEVIWIQKLLMDLKSKVTLPIDLFCDNKSALQLAINHVFHERSKHFEIDVHFIKEKIAKGLLNKKKDLFFRPNCRHFY
ncbi:ribonuclease H-like domain-containing protein [Tanacetum coccineum]